MFQISSLIEKIEYFIQLDTFVTLWIFLALGYLFYKFLLQEISVKRHLNLKNRFQSTFFILACSSFLSAAHWVSIGHFDSLLMNRISNYVAFFSLLAGAISVIKLAQIGAYLYLFFKNISQGIPRLIVNLFSVIFSLAVISFIASEVFMIQVTALLATSAVFSLVLGLALQDTLGNLFSGVAMQIGQPYKIGDWIEISSDSRKWIGQVQEITWRATFLSSFSDEWIMIPNKTMAQSQIVIFSNNHKTLRHSQMFRVGFDADIALVKQLLFDGTVGVKNVLNEPAPRVLLIETTESWLTFKVFYSLADFSLKYQISDQVISDVLEKLRKNNIALASNRMDYNSVKAAD